MAALASGAAPLLSVVVPAYNESSRIAQTIASIRDELDASPYSWEVVIVDDGSDDGTSAQAIHGAAGDARVVVIEAAHAGKGAAVRRGMLAARGAWRLLSDADLSTPVAEVERLLCVASRDSADIVIGSREGSGAVRIDEPWYRHVIGRVFNWTVKGAVLRGIDDTQCGFKLFRAAAAESLFARQRIDGFGFDVEVLYLAGRAGFVVRQVPVTWTYNGSSKVTMASGIGGFLDILRVRWNALTGEYER